MSNLNTPVQMNDNEMKMQHRILELEAANSAYLHEVSFLRETNSFLRSIIEKNDREW